MSSSRNLPRKLKAALEKISPHMTARGLCDDLRGLLRELDDETGEMEQQYRMLRLARAALRERLRQCQERLRLHVENSPLAVVEWEHGETITQWSREAVRIFGWSAGEMLGKTLREANLVPPDDLAKVEEMKERLSSGAESSVVCENRNLTKDGRVITCTWFNSALRAPDGSMSSVLSLVHDVTREREAQAALEKTVTSLRILVSNSADAAVLFDQQGTVLCASECAAACVDSSPEELEGRSWMEFLPQEQLLHARFCFADLLKNPSLPANTMLKLQTLAGAVCWFGIRASVVPVGGGDGFLVHLERI